VLRLGGSQRQGRGRNETRRTVELLVETSERTDRQTDRRSQHLSALEVFLNDMRYINPRFTYLLTNLATATGAENSASTVVGQHVVTAAVVACTS